jgi:hypothetical protein
MGLEKVCTICGGKSFRAVIDSWMKRTFLFVEKGQLNMCESCGAKFLVCPKCNTLMGRVHPALESFELSPKCPNPDCDYEDPAIKAWDGVSAR